MSLSYSFSSHGLLPELELAEKFYWNLAQKLARRMTDLPLTTEGMLEESQSFLDGSLADDDSEETVRTQMDELSCACERRSSPTKLTFLHSLLSYVVIH